MGHHRLPAAALVVAFIVLAPAPAHALYIDPGAGSLLVQIVISAMLGVTFVFHRTISRGWRSVRDAVSRLRRPPRVPTKSAVAEDERPSHTDRGTRS
jgi:hypothetical protein